MGMRLITPKYSEDSRRSKELGGYIKDRIDVVFPSRWKANTTAIGSLEKAGCFVS